MVDKLEKTSKIALLSFVLVYSFVIFITFVCISIKTSFQVYIIAILLDILVIPTSFVLIDLSGGLKKYFMKWQKIPKHIHYLLVIVIGSVIGLMSYKVLIPALKKEYERTK